MTTMRHPRSTGSKTMKSPADLIISIVALVVFLAAFAMTLDWPIEAARFPRVITGVGAACSGLFLLSSLVQARRSFRKPTSEHKPNSEATSSVIREEQETIVEDEVDSDDVGYVFDTAGAGAWIRALLWIASFFILTYLLGVYLAGGLFAVLYLRFGGKKSWLFSCIYAVVLSTGLWALFDQFLQLPMPRGLLALI